MYLKKAENQFAPCGPTRATRANQLITPTFVYSSATSCSDNRCLSSRTARAIKTRRWPCRKPLQYGVNSSIEIDAARMCAIATPRCFRTSSSGSTPFSEDSDDSAVDTQECAAASRALSCQTSPSLTEASGRVQSQRRTRETTKGGDFVRHRRPSTGLSFSPLRATSTTTPNLPMLGLNLS